MGACWIGLSNPLDHLVRTAEAVEAGEPMQFRAGRDDEIGTLAMTLARLEFADIVRSQLRESDAVARYGGEEFVVCLRGADLAGAVTAAEKIRAAVDRADVEIAPGVSAHITASFGVAASSSRQRSHAPDAPCGSGALRGQAHGSQSSRVGRSRDD